MEITIKAKDIEYRNFANGMVTFQKDGEFCEGFIVSMNTRGEYKVRIEENNNGSYK